MSMRRKFINEHPLKQWVRALGLKLWELRDMTGISESKLSRYLNGVDQMPYLLEERLSVLLDVPKRENPNKPPKNWNAFEVLDRTCYSRKGQEPE